MAYQKERRDVGGALDHTGGVLPASAFLGRVRRLSAPMTTQEPKISAGSVSSVCLAWERVEVN